MSPVRLALAAALAALLGFLGGLWVAWPPGRAASAPPDLAFGPCAEAIPVDQKAPRKVLVGEVGPDGYANPDRRVELLAQRQGRGLVVWARFTTSTSISDRIWFDWTYHDTDEGDYSKYRQCGAQPVTRSPDTPAALATDAAGLNRMFRACGQVPAADRVPGESGTICTQWVIPATLPDQQP
ncbi:hypothetical protein ACIBG8_36680 [Nonomuraea sp. NPDC050556]|uniref:hypothetical protein n=1 Tax=Nonomuraea sp. NPDC050556 TaxID=3364369 RepID=UPI0037B87449